jgi:hypothetical protein
VKRWNPEQEHFTDGMVVEIITGLSSISFGASIHGASLPSTFEAESTELAAREQLEILPRRNPKCAAMILSDSYGRAGAPRGGAWTEQG